MALKSSQIRVGLRWLHLILGLVVMCYIYSPFSEHVWFQYVMKWIIIPIITLSGIWIWKFQSINRKLKIQ